MKENYFLIHGSFGSPFSNWIPWLRSTIEMRDCEVYTPDLPTGVGNQTYLNWARVMKSYVEANLIGKETTIFAHSIATIFICKFLATEKIRVKRLVFVCGFNNYFGIDKDYDAVNESMYFDNLADVKKYCEDIICYYTDNDPYVSFKAEEAFASKIGHQKFVISGGGHLNAESGYIEFPELLEWVR